MNYQDGMVVRLGDRVEFSGAAATVVAIGPTNEYGPGFSESEWKDILREGFLIRFENGSLLRLDEPEQSEDLKLIKH